jgi:hypothetical protein
MLIPSFYHSGNGARPWSIGRAAVYGAGIGLFAALVKSYGPGQMIAPSSVNLLQGAAAVLGFALLCAGAAAGRNFVARRLIGPDAN